MRIFSCFLCSGANKDVRTISPSDNNDSGKSNISEKAYHYNENSKKFSNIHDPEGKKVDPKNPTVRLTKAASEVLAQRERAAKKS